MKKILITFFSILVCSPLMYLATQIFSINSSTIHHLWQYSLPDYILTSLILIIGVLLISGIIGISLAWLMSQYSFRFMQKTMHWILIIPISMPSYILAYAYTDFLQFSGPVQSFLRHIYPPFNIGDVRSLPLAVIIFSINLYPYIYLMTYTAFKLQNQNMLDVAKILGVKNIFRKVAFPLAWPSILAALSLVCMEVLSDYGTSSYFGLQTLSLGIYKSWIIFDDKKGAVLLALILFGIILGLLAIELKSRKKQQFYSNKLSANKVIKPANKYLHTVAYVSCLLIFTSSLCIPIYAMIRLLSWDDVYSYRWGQYFVWLKNTLLIAFFASFSTTALAFVLNIYLKGHRLLLFLGLGYAIPGTILAVGVLGVMSLLLIFGVNLNATIWLLLYAYCIRFYAISQQNIGNSYAQISPNIADVASLLGKNKLYIIYKIYIPLLKKSLFASFLLVGIDSIKELPCTLLLRPFNFDTLAVISHQLASDERIAEISIPALSMIILSLLPMILVYQNNKNK
jgi:iron(III) transport system permease protein